MTTCIPVSPVAKRFLFALLITFSVQLPAQMLSNPPRSDGKVQLASLRPALVWQRTSPKPGSAVEGPVLYQIIFRSSAHIGSIPKIGPTYTLVDSGLALDNSGNVIIGGLTINGTTGVVTFPAQQSSGNNTMDFWSLGGNTGTTAGTNRLGTNDNQPLELWVNNQRAYRIEPAVANSIGPTYVAPNVIGGSPGNTVIPGVGGATIAGGGATFYPKLCHR